MGGAASIYQSSRQDTINNIAQISRANCLNTCLNNQQLTIEFVNSILNGNINYTQICLIEGASCNLKSALDNSLLNSQSARLVGSIERETDLFSFLAGFTSEDITQENLQRITNDVTQMIESTCHNKMESENAPVDLVFRDSIINGDINLTDEKAISNSKCVIENMAKNYIENDQDADLEADIKVKGSLSSIVGILLLIGLLVVLGIFALGKGGLSIPGAFSSSDKKSSKKGK